MAALRRRLLAIEGRPHLVFFRHDEVMVHSPAAVADDVAAAVREAAAEAGRLLFGDCPVDFALDVRGQARRGQGRRRRSLLVELPEGGRHDQSRPPGRARRHHQHRIRLPAADGVQVVPIGTLGP